MRLVLHGALAEFGGPYTLAVQTPRQAVRLIGAQVPGFLDAVRRHQFRVVRGNVVTGLELGEEDLNFRTGTADLHLVPVVAGAGSGIGKIVAGVAIAALAWYAAPAIVGAMGPTMGMATEAFTIAGYSVSYSAIAGVGVGLAVMGASSMLASMVQSTSSLESVDQRPSYLFNGVTNSTEQGGARPVLVGRFLAGSTVLSSGLVLGDEVSGAIASLAVTQALKGVTDADAQEYSEKLASASSDILHLILEGLR